MPTPQIDLMKGLSAEESGQLMLLGKPITASAGDVLFDVGSSADRVYQVVRGRVTLTLPMQVRGNQEDVLIEERLSGETLGWSGLIPPHRFTLKASVPVESELIAFPRESLLGHFEGRPHVAFNVTRNVASVIGHRLQVFQTMWLREMQRVLELRYSS
jgi:CRP-like cAMP-binding protein